MNLSILDREQLEDILLNPPRVEANPLQCSESMALDCQPTGHDALPSIRLLRRPVTVFRQEECMLGCDARTSTPESAL